MNILALGAHPDDIEFGCGGTLTTYASAGHRVFLMVLTGGERGGESHVRREEQERSARIIRAEQIFWGGYQDTQIPLHEVLVHQIEEVIRKVEPSFLFVHYSDDTHQDHRHLAQAVLTASRYSRNVLFYEVPTTQNFTPTVFVDIDPVLKEKIASLEAHASQVQKTNIPGLTIVDIARAAAHFRGVQGRVRNAEGFVPLRLFIGVSHNEHFPFSAGL